MEVFYRMHDWTIKQNSLCLSQEGGFGLRIDGVPYKTLDIAEGESWRKRRHMLSPAFSSSKLRLVCVCVCVCEFACVELWVWVCQCVCAVDKVILCSRWIDPANLLVFLVQCLQMEPLFSESKNRLMVKIADLAETGQAANAIE